MRPARSEGGGLRVAAGVPLAVPPAPLRAPALQPAPHAAAPAPLCRPRARPFEP